MLDTTVTHLHANFSVLISTPVVTVINTFMVFMCYTDVIAFIMYILKLVD